MKIQKLIDADQVYLDLEARDLVQALEVVADAAADGIGLDPRAVVQELLEREKLGSTSVGDGFAIPHCKIANLKEIAVFLARFASDVDFGASDEQPVRFFFVVLSPPDQPAAHLQVLSQIVRVLKREELRTQLMTAHDSEEVIEVLRTAAEAEGL
jgi:mannitol/fructose-specific phosphotransferase system IIA component (Ntr-type)